MDTISHYEGSLLGHQEINAPFMTKNVNFPWAFLGHSKNTDFLIIVLNILMWKLNIISSRNMFAMISRRNSRLFPLVEIRLNPFETNKTKYV